VASVGPFAVEAGEGVGAVGRAVGADHDAVHTTDAIAGVLGGDRLLADLGVLDRGYALLPADHVDEVVAGAFGDDRQGRRRRVGADAVGLQPVGLEAKGLRRGLVAEAAEVVGAGVDIEVVGEGLDGGDREAEVRCAVGPDDVADEQALLLVVEHACLVEVAVEHHAALLHAQAGVVIRGVEQVAGDVVGDHGAAPVLRSRGRRRGGDRGA
jgi:hypothetical protein